MNSYIFMHSLAHAEATGLFDKTYAAYRFANCSTSKLPSASASFLLRFFDTPDESKLLLVQGDDDAGVSAALTGLSSIPYTPVQYVYSNKFYSNQYYKNT